jgi:hypothetical protein
MYEAKAKGGDQLIAYEPEDAGQDQLSAPADWAG